MADEATAPLTLTDEAQIDAVLDGLTPEAGRALYRSLLAEVARGEGVAAVAAFGELVFGKKPAEHHRAWLTHVLAHPRTVIVAPPESAKTTWITKILTAWLIGKNPLSTNGICSASDEAAEKMAAAIADTIENSPRWKMVFPDVAPDKLRGWSSTGYHVQDLSVDRAHGAGEWARRRYGILDASLMAAGVGSSSWNGVRISGLFVFDDMHDRRSKTQQKTCDDTVEFFNDTALPRATREAKVVVAQTRWNPKDVVSKAKTLSSFKVFEHPAILTGEDGVEYSYWPDQWPMERLRERQAEITPVVFELVYQGNDRAVEGTVLKAEWLRPFPFLQFEKHWPRYFGVDFAQRLREILKQDDDPDDFALTVMADTGTRLVVEDVFAGEYFMADAETLLFAKAAIFQPRVIGLEVNGAAAKTFYQNLLKRMRLLGVNHVIAPIHQTVDKGTRLAEVAPYFSSGQIMVSDEPSPGLDKFRAQWVMFPRGHDDTLDSAYNCWRVAGHLLPSKTVTQQREDERRARTAISPARAIELAYR